MFFSKPNYIKDAEQLVSYAQKVLNYRRDVLKPDVLAEIEAQIQEVRNLVKQKQKEPAVEAMKKPSSLLERYGWPRKELGWRENVEVFVVAFIVAAGVRAYILQPFKIPTGSMQPTLNGIIVTPTDKPIPNPIQRTAELALFGRSYFDVVPKEDDKLHDVMDVKMGLPFLGAVKVVDGSRIVTIGGKMYDVPVPSEPLKRGFNLHRGKKMTAGESFVHGYATVGDHVFVDKVTYNFRKPKKDDVFVFLAKDIEMIERNTGTPGQFYIKRLVGVPGDTVRVEPPNLRINGVLSELPGIKRVMSKQNGYGGYTNPSNSPARIEDYSPTSNLGNSMIWVNEGYEHTVSPGHYYAMGDNSANSWDSRNWGEVPARNAVGRGVFVWWPFSSHWGFVK